jgi:hypothetical protein
MTPSQIDPPPIAVLSRRNPDGTGLAEAAVANAVAASTVTAAATTAAAGRSGRCCSGCRRMPHPPERRQDLKDVEILFFHAAHHLATFASRPVARMNPRVVRTTSTSLAVATSATSVRSKPVCPIPSPFRPELRRVRWTQVPVEDIARRGVRVRVVEDVERLVCAGDDIERIAGHE